MNPFGRTTLLADSEKLGSDDEPGGIPRQQVSCLRRPFHLASIFGFYDRTFQPHPDQMQRTPINDASRERQHQFSVGNASEAGVLAEGHGAAGSSHQRGLASGMKHFVAAGTSGLSWRPCAECAGTCF
jgi:hypothetical protein